MIISKKYYRQLKKIVREIFSYDSNNYNINEREITRIISNLGPKGRELLISLKGSVYAYGTCNAWDMGDLLLSTNGNLLKVVGWETIPFQEKKFYYEKLN